MGRPFRLTSPMPALFIVLAALLASASIVRGLYDPDYFWHVATGRTILESGSIPVRDPFSFTWYGEPWIADQWLGQALMAAVQDAFGIEVLLILFGAIAALGPVVVAEAMRREGASSRVAIALAVLTSLALLTQVTARPQVISFALMGLLLAILVRIRPHSTWLLVGLPPLFLIWANTHGFYIVGLGVGFVYMVATIIGRTPMAERRVAVVIVGIGCLLAASVTPQGFEGIVYSASFGNLDDWVGSQIAEWQSPNFHDPQFLPFLAFITALMVFGVRNAPGWLSVTALAGLAIGLMAIRSIGIGSLLMLPAATLSMRRPGVGGRAQRPQPARRWLELGIALVASVFVTASALGSYPVRPDADYLPVEGTAVLADVQPDVRVLANFGWGGYVLHELHGDGGRVFVDGRMPKYRPDLMEDYARIINADGAWRSLVDDYRVDAMLLRPTAVITKGIAQAAGWCEVYRDPVQVLLFRACPVSARD